MNQDKLKLTYIHFTAKHGSKTKRLLEFLAEKMERECGGFAEGQIHHALQATKGGDADCVRENGFLLLHDDKTLYCASILNYASIQTRWVPPKHRNKGYATLMLRKYEEMMQGTPHRHLPVWIVSHRRMDGINTRAGWVKHPEPCKDKKTKQLPKSEEDYQFEWVPAWGVETHKEFRAVARNQVDKDEEKAWRKAWWREWCEFVERYALPTNLDLKYT